MSGQDQAMHQHPLVFPPPNGMSGQAVDTPQLPDHLLPLRPWQGWLPVAHAFNLQSLHFPQQQQHKHAFTCARASQGMSDMDVDTFCSRCVDPMGEESDHVQLVALTDTLQVGTE